MEAGFTRFGIGHNKNGYSFIQIYMADEDEKPTSCYLDLLNGKSKYLEYKDEIVSFI